MKQARRLCVALAVVGVLVLSASAADAGGVSSGPDPVGRPDNPVTGQYIVTLRATSGSIPGIAGLLASAHGGQVLRTFQSAIQGFTVHLTDAQAEALALDPRVASVEQDGYVHILDTQNPTPSWGLDRIDQVNLPLDNSYTYPNSGAGVHAYMIDTGIRTSHTDFGGRASVGVDEIGDGQNGQDCNGHGTHTAGTVGGTNYGVAKNVLLVAVRVLDCNGSGTYSQVIAGVDWVTTNAIKPAVANMSIGGSKSTALNNAVTNSINSGVTYAVAAGNSNANACNYSPSSTTAAITVGASTSSDARASFSNYGSCVDIFAPGDTITSDYNTSDTAAAVASGTSMATPHVTGVAALYLSANPNATPAAVASALTSNATMNHITSPGSGSPNRLLYEGAYIGGGAQPPAPTAPSAPSLTATAGNGQVTLSWSANSNGAAIDSYSIYKSTVSGQEKLLVTPSGTGTTYTDTAVTNGTPYFYQVTAHNSVGNSLPSAEQSATPTVGTLPGAPTLTASTPFFFFNGVNLSWTTPSAGSSPIIRYNIYRGTSTNTEVLVAYATAPSSGGRDTGTTRGVRYYYKVTAVTAVGESPLSNESSAVSN
jgi:subtilisin family serine protease